MAKLSFEIVWHARWTQLEVTVPASQKTVGLHAHLTEVSSVEVNGQVATFTSKSFESEPLPKHWRNSDIKEAAQKVAQLVREQYRKFLAHQRDPSLLITLPEAVSGAEDCENIATGDDTSKDLTETTDLTVKVRYEG